MKRFSVCCLTVMAVLASAGISRATIIYPLGETSTSGLGHAGGTTTSISVGWDFQVNSDNVLVMQLGTNSFETGPVTLTLWDVGSKTELGQIVVSAVAGTWVFGDLSSPLSLTNGHEYAVIGTCCSDSAPVWYLAQNPAPSAFKPTGTIQYLESRLGDGSADVWPISTLGYALGAVDIGYEITPEPAGIFLSLGGLCLVGIVGRRMRLRGVR